MAAPASRTAETPAVPMSPMDYRLKELRDDYEVYLGFVIAWIRSSLGLATPFTYPRARIVMTPLELRLSVDRIMRQRIPTNDFVLHCLHRAIDKRMRWTRIEAERDGHQPASIRDATRTLEESFRLIQSLPRHGSLCFTCEHTVVGETRAISRPYVPSAHTAPRRAAMNFNQEDVEAARILRGMRDGR